MNFKQDNKIIYIVARGHSGTTILDIILGNSEDAFSCGELISGISQINPKCSCGEELKDCVFWKNIKKEIENKINWDKFCHIIVSQRRLNSIKYFFQKKIEGKSFVIITFYIMLFLGKAVKVLLLIHQKIFLGEFYYIYFIAMLSLFI
jgi:hypothetical protein